MTPILWTVAALIAGLLTIVIATRLSLKRRPPLEMPAGESLPSTPLQRWARACLALGLLLSAAAAAMVFGFGPDRWYHDDPVRLTVTALMLAAIVVLGFFSMRVGRWSARGDAALDERDRAIFDRAPSAQRVGLLVMLAVWTIGLTEAFSGTKLVPVVYIYLVFWSCLLVDLLALPIGVLFGYRRN